MTIDLTQFHGVFFEESFEALDSMEAALLKLDVGAPDPERINTIFRVAHSIKGGSATFGFTAVASFTHTLETMLDEMRAGRMNVTQAISDLLLKSVDVMRDMLRAVQNHQAIDAQRVADLQFDIELAIAQKNAAPAASAQAGVEPAAAALPPAAPVAAAPAAATSPAAVTVAAPEPATTVPSMVPRWAISFRPGKAFVGGDGDPLRVMRELEAMGTLRAFADVGGVPSLAELDTARCYVSWRVELEADVSEQAIRDVFAASAQDWELSISGGPQSPGGSETDPESSATDDAHGDSESIPAVAENPQLSGGSREAREEGPAQIEVPAAAVASAAETSAAAVASTAEAGAAAVASAAPMATSTQAAAATHTAAPTADSSSIRVSVEKIDELMNTVGELVITQSMLSQLGQKLEGPDADRFRSSLAQLERNMRGLQESVMRVRMLPISFVFSRFPRMARDLAQRLGKQIELKLTGQETELDKTVMEKIGDPLTHLVRNSIDHGIESPEARVAKGKPAVGVVHLDACHRGGNIAVEVSDDGAGLDKDRILAKARSRGIVGQSDVLTDEQIYDLIFEPGFSTAEKTTDVSGRGVGMDVVRRNVHELGGKIEIRSTPGKGSRFTITLPLTLAIVDGQSVAVGSETYIVPLVSMVESMQLQPQQVSRLPGLGEVLSFRGEYLPIVRLHEVFSVEPRSRALHEGLIVVAEGDGRRVGLFVDDLLGQQQVVIKSLETNYGRIEGVSGATILGDGSVSLILDLPGLIRAASLRQAA